MQSNIDNIESTTLIFTSSILSGLYALGPLAEYWLDRKVANDIFQQSIHNSIRYQLSLIYIQNLPPKATLSEQVIGPFQSTVMANIMPA